jgi:hypothetical protein
MILLERLVKVKETPLSFCCSQILDRNNEQFTTVAWWAVHTAVPKQGQNSHVR